MSTATEPGTRLVVVMFRVGEIVMESALVATSCVGLWLSATRTVKLNVPVVVGVPEIIPVFGAMLRPPGRAPAEMLQVLVPFPPVVSTILL